MKRVVLLGISLLILLPLGSQTYASSPDPTTITTSTYQLATGFGFQQKVCFVNGYYVAFFTDGANMVYATSADGTTWSGTTNVRASTVGQYFGISCDSSNNVYYAYADGTAQNFKWRYGSFASGTITWTNSEQTVATTGTAATYATISATSTSDIWVTAMTTQSAKTHLETWYYAGTSFSKVNDFNTQGSGNWAGIILPLSTTAKKALVFTLFDSVSVVDMQTTGNSGTTWTTSIPTTSNYDFEYSGATAVGDTIEFVGWVSGGNMVYWNCAYPCSASSPTETTLDTSGNVAGTGISTDGLSTIVIFVSDASAMKSFTSSDRGVTWGAKTALSTETTVQAGTITMSKTLNAGNAFGMWTAGAGPNFNVRFGKILAQETVNNPQGLAATYTVNGGPSSSSATTLLVDYGTGITVVGVHSCTYTSVTNSSSVYEFSHSGIQILVNTSASSLADFTGSTPPYVTYATGHQHTVMCVNSASNLVVTKAVSGSSVSFFTSSSPTGMMFAGPGSADEVDFQSSIPSNGGGGGNGGSGGGGGGGTIVTTTTTNTTAAIASTGNPALIPTGIAVIGLIFGIVFLPGFAKRRKRTRTYKARRGPA